MESRSNDVPVIGLADCTTGEITYEPIPASELAAMEERRAALQDEPPPPPSPIDVALRAIADDPALAAHTRAAIADALAKDVES